MEHSIFSGLSPANLKIAYEAAKDSPEALAALAILAVAVILLLGFAGAMTAHHVGGFASHVQEEEERLRMEEECEEKSNNAPEEEENT